MLHRLIKPVILHCICNVFCIWLQNRIMMPHDHSMSGSFDHIKVIAAVSECIDFIINQMQFFMYVLNCSCLGILFLYTFIDTSQTVDMVKY